MLRTVGQDDCHGQLQQERRYVLTWTRILFLQSFKYEHIDIAGEMIDKLALTYNRTRQAVITGELIEIISGAAAL